MWANLVVGSSFPLGLVVLSQVADHDNITEDPVHSHNQGQEVTVEEVEQPGKGIHIHRGVQRGVGNQAARLDEPVLHSKVGNQRSHSGADRQEHGSADQAHQDDHLQDVAAGDIEGGHSQRQIDNTGKWQHGVVGQHDSPHQVQGDSDHTGDPNLGVAQQNSGIQTDEDLTVVLGLLLQPSGAGLGNGSQRLHEVLCHHGQQRQRGCTGNAQCQGGHNRVAAYQAEDNSEDEADDMVFGKYADLTLEPSNIEAGVLDEGDLAQQQLHRIQHGAEEECRVRRGDAGDAGLLQNQRFHSVADDKLADDTHGGNNEGKHDPEGLALSEGDNQNALESLAPNIPQVDVDGLGLSDEEHDQVDEDLEGEQQECVLPGPSDGGEGGPAAVQDVKGLANGFRHSLRHGSNGPGHITDNKRDTGKSHREGNRRGESLCRLHFCDQAQD